MVRVRVGSCMCASELHTTGNIHKTGLDESMFCILCDTVTIFANIGQFSCCGVFIYSNFFCQCVTFSHDDFLYCFFLLAESYERINQSIME